MSYKETPFDVEGMTCPSCVRHVNAALSDLEGVIKVEVRLREGKVFVQYDPESVTVDSMIDALREAGYDSAVNAAV
jgi:copper chaperone